MLQNANCNGDFVLIPTTFDPGTTSDRHCGNSLSAVSASAPLICKNMHFEAYCENCSIEIMQSLMDSAYFL